MILFQGDLTAVGGSQRVLFEEARFFKQKGIDTHILCFDFKLEALFDGSYKENINIIAENSGSKMLLLKTLCRILALRKEIRKIRPDIILSQHPLDHVYLYLATLFTPFPYASHVHETVSWFGSLRKHTLIYKKAMKEIRQSTPGHEQFIPTKAPHWGLTRRILDELYATMEYLAIGKAKKIFVLSNQMRWEVHRLYRREAVVIKGGLSPQIFDYEPSQDIKQKLGLQDKLVILTISRLEIKKRVDLVIKAFKQACAKLENIVLVIGGKGSEENKLKNMVRELNIADRVRFAGYIPEGELWDYYAGCDLFVTAEWADFDIAPLEALALQRKVVWPTSMEIDDTLAQNRHIFTASLRADDFAYAIERALTAKITERNDLYHYTWDKYCEETLKELESIYL